VSKRLLTTALCAGIALSAAVSTSASADIRRGTPHTFQGSGASYDSAWEAARGAKAAYEAENRQICETKNVKGSQIATGAFVISLATWCRPAPPAVRISLIEGGRHMPAGFRNHRVIHEDGTWTVTRLRDWGPPAEYSGQMSPNAAARLQELVASPEFAHEAATTHGLCSETEGEFTLQAGDIGLGWDQTCEAGLAAMPNVQLTESLIRQATSPTS
jgi:hypothetical protein